MTRPEIGRLRLANQRIDAPLRGTPADAVSWLAAVQAQDWYGALWAVGLRVQGARIADVERAFNRGDILRTHLLRPTWHFVTPADIRWLLALTAPRVHGANRSTARRRGLDEATYRRSDAVIVRALRDGPRTRDELRPALQEAGLPTEGENRLAYLLMHAELEGIMCSGPRRGRQFTYALLDERAPAAPALPEDEALATLARRYFTSRGPATVHDFAKWSGLLLGQARRGLAAVEAEMERSTWDGQMYWLPRDPPAPADAPAAHLLSIYDEYISGYQDRSAIVTPEHGARLVGMGNALAYIIVLDGEVVGTWRRVVDKDTVRIELAPFEPLDRRGAQAVDEAAQRYGAFMGLRVVE